MSNPSDLDDIDLPDGLPEEVTVPHALAKAEALQAAKASPPAKASQPVQPAQKKSAAEPVAPEPDKDAARAARQAAREAAREARRRAWREIAESWLSILVAGMVLTIVFAAGVLYGIVLSGHAGLYPVLLASPAAVVLAPLEAPAGVVLLLLASLYAFLRGKTAESATLWNLLGWLLLALFLAGVA